MVDQPRWRRVEDVAQNEAAARRDDDGHLLRYQVVMAHQPLVAPRLILPGIAVQVAECRRETIAAILARCPAKTGNIANPAEA